ncbi:putative U6 snRNA-associated Sm-like protein LSm2 [Cocos nucifera]|nr:putative U6 snRNA-associated Sm-like protein LSm2 [Cocos nucifera]
MFNSLLMEWTLTFFMMPQGEKPVVVDGPSSDPPFYIRGSVVRYVQLLLGVDIDTLHDTARREACGD